MQVLSSFVYICIDVADSVIKRGEFHSPLPFVCLYQDMFNELTREVTVLFVDICGIIDRHCLNFSFHNDLLSMVFAPYVLNHPIYDINSFVFVFVTYADIRV